MEKYTSASGKTAAMLASMVASDGRLTSPEVKDDICFYYKLPTLLLISGYRKEADAVIDFIKRQFLRPDGDILSNTDGPKSMNSVYCEYYAYTNVWVCMAAQRLGRFDIAQPTYEYLKKYYNPDVGGFTTNAPYASGNKVMDSLTASHFGLMSLYFGDLNKASKAGDLLIRLVSQQSHLDQGFYLRMTGDGTVITDFPSEASIFHIVKKDDPVQAYFFLGYPVSFLAKLFMATNTEKYLDAAVAILEFCLTCCDGLYSTHMAHKVAWGAAQIARLKSEQKYAALSRKIADFLCSIQSEEGFFLNDADPQDKFDQSTEIAIWLSELSAELSALK